MKKRLFSLFLAICMILSLIPVTAFAEGEPEDNSGKMTFLCQTDQNADNGDIYYKLDDAGEFIKVGVADHKYEPIVLGESTSITIKIKPNEGYKLDTGRGVKLRVNGNENPATAEEIAALEFKYNLSDLVDGSTVATSTFELEFGFTELPKRELSIHCGGDIGVGGAFMYKFAGSESFTTAEVKTNPEDSAKYYEPIDLDENTSITIKIVPLPEYRLEDVCLREDGSGSSATEDEITALLSEAGNTYNLSSDKTNFSFDFALRNKLDEGNRPFKGVYSGTYVENIPVTVNGELNFCINDSKFYSDEDIKASADGLKADYHYTGDTVDFYVECHINSKYTKLTINGTNYLGQIPTTDAERLAAVQGQLYRFKITVAKADSYEIESTIGEMSSEEMVVGNFSWRYGGSGDPDDLIEHGKMELKSIKLNGVEFTQTDFLKWEDDENGGSAVLPAGAEVTVKIIPEYGYQLTSFELNGFPFTTGDEQSVFTFEVARGNFHLGAKITGVRDEVKSEADDVITSGNITLGSGEIETGSAVLSVAAAGNTNKSGFETEMQNHSELSGYTLNSILDINLNHVLYKGCEDKFWKTPMNNLASNAEISLDLAGDFKNVVVLHKKHDGTFEKLATTFENGKITFSTKEFSDFALAVEELSTDNGCVSVGFDNHGDANSKVMVDVGSGTPYSANPWKWSDYSDGATPIKFTVTVPEDRKGNTPIVDVELKDYPETNTTVPVTKNGDTYTFSITPNALFSGVENPSFLVFVNWTEYDKLYPDDDQFMVLTNTGEGNGTISVSGAIPVDTKSFGNEEKYLFDKSASTLNVIFKPASGKVLHGFFVGETKYGFDDGIALPEQQSDGRYDFMLNVSGSDREIYIEAVFGDERNQVAKPVITPSGGSFTGSQTISISCVEGAAIRYSIDDGEYHDYEGEFTISSSTTIIAYAVMGGMEDSDFVTATFTKKTSTGDNDRPSSGGSGGSSGGSSTPDNPTLDGKEQSWSDVANDIEKLSEDKTETIGLNGNKTVPEDVIKAIASSNAEVTFKVDRVFSWTIDGENLDEKDAKAADFTITKTKVTADNNPRGTEGTSFSVNGTNVNSKLNINFKTTHVQKFANLYKKVDGKLVFVDNVKIDENGAANGLDVSEKGEYVVMLCEFSDRAGDIDNDGIMNPKDSFAVLKDFVEIEKGVNPLVADMNGDGYINPKDAMIILKKFVGIE